MPLRGSLKINVLYILQVKNHFKNIGVPADVKYIDPTYMIRACRANASDRILCAVLGQNAVRLLLSRRGFFSLRSVICILQLICRNAIISKLLSF